ncbi:peptidoglycan DD-metalloendopeptidase family protein [Paenibacillus ginsengarvi]|uniref:M23 family peptidase n=1 Tax=Paenibacillus ginsengarvi TaxID=400777 RepID=A0A3B0BUR9_9BACL|nr:peptidoglycan DD-metalloendopeptidase family protein [Paenibacillus ginsengarvi]RKN77155.1 M23 family peptidase [Paenibacillus ginsengarvi]
MNPRNLSGTRRTAAARKRRTGRTLVFTAAALAGLAAVLLAYDQRSAVAPSIDAVIESLEVKRPAPELVEFRMTDFDRGWQKYSDDVVKVTSDGGITWTEASPEAAGVPGSPDGSRSGRGEWTLAPVSEKRLDSLVYDRKAMAVKMSQFLTEKIGWALLEGGSGLPNPLLVTADGGETWHAEVTAEVRSAAEAEKKREAQAAAEAALYESPDKARLAMRSVWALMPSQASPGDTVLVRHDKPGEVSWQGKTYLLQPYGFGYYTYLPIPMSAKPGDYPIGDALLAIKAKKFDTQYLQVSQQMESMKQDTNRIAADQKKIDTARSKSEPEFLFSSAFIQPIQGILTTPYGHTRYVNGKYDSSHMAIDLAAKEGTPIKATNDGIVALADSLYLTGNSIYLDHGMGLFSQYAHMSELRVKTGDRVKKGDIIGLVGTTGFSTGPHLHFTFWVHNVQGNPNLFFDKTPMQWTAAPK